MDSVRFKYKPAVFKFNQYLLSTISEPSKNTFCVRQTVKEL